MKIAMTSVFVDDPIKAHKFYTEVLGFKSSEFDEDAQLAVVVSDEDPDSTTLLLEPRGDGFALEYQTKVLEFGVPAIVFSVKNPTETMSKLKELGVVIRTDLDNPDWGLENMFEDTCGNLLMLQQHT